METVQDIAHGNAISTSETLRRCDRARRSEGDGSGMSLAMFPTERGSTPRSSTAL